MPAVDGAAALAEEEVPAGLVGPAPVGRLLGARGLPAEEGPQLAVFGGGADRIAGVLPAAAEPVGVGADLRSGYIVGLEIPGRPVRGPGIPCLR
jgi:hypothetical protein